MRNMQITLKVINTKQAYIKKLILERELKIIPMKFSNLKIFIQII